MTSNSFMYRNVLVIFVHFFGWQFTFQYGENIYYAFYTSLDYAKENAKQYIDKLIAETEIHNDDGI